MKAILMLIQSKHLFNILNDKKTIELHKRFPKDYRGWVYLYCAKSRPFLADFGDCEYPYKSGGIEYTNDTKSIIGHDAEILNGKVVGRVWVDNVEETITLSWDTQTATLSEFDLSVKSCVSIKDLNNNFNKGFAIHFSKLEIFDKPKELGEFYKPLCEYYQDGICIRNANKMGCEDSKKDINPDGSVNVYQCNKPKKSITIAPQSWQYIYIEEDK